MKIILKCTTKIDGQEVPMTSIGQGQNALAKATCLDASDSEARAAINRQHAILAPAETEINFEFDEVKKTAKATAK